ncbi:MAG: hypothetical protein ACKV19_27870 [Verrucomicrobiales bacterium]
MNASLLLRLGFISGLVLAGSGHGEETPAEPAVTHSVQIDPAANNASTFTLFSPLVLPPIGATGTIDQVNGATLLDGDATFTSAFNANVPLTLTIVDGPYTGLGLQIVRFFESYFTADRDLSGMELAGARYEVRATPTPDSLIEYWGLYGGTTTTADLIWIPQENGGYLRVFHSLGGLAGIGWRGVGMGFRDMSQTPIAPWKGMFIQRRGPQPLTIDFVGQAASTPRLIPLTPGFNPVSRGTIEPLTLARSRLHEAPGLQGGETGWGAMIWNPDGKGLYSQYFWSGGGLLGTGWRRVGGGTADCSDVPLASAFLIQLRGGLPTGVMLPPKPQ